MLHEIALKGKGEHKVRNAGGYIRASAVAILSHPQTYHLLAASVYAYTGWRPHEVLKGVSDLLGSAKDEGIAGTLHLSNGAAMHLWINTKTAGTVHLTIELGGDESR